MTCFGIWRTYRESDYIVLEVETDGNWNRIMELNPKEDLQDLIECLIPYVIANQGASHDQQA